MSAERHACPDCGASHAIRATKKPAARRPATNSCTDLDVTTCPHCKSAVLAGRIGGVDRRLDPDPINELGWRTYRGIGHMVYLRCGPRADITTPLHHWPLPELAYGHVLHVCGTPVPPALRENNVIHQTREIEFPDNPPY